MGRHQSGSGRVSPGPRATGVLHPVRQSSGNAAARAALRGRRRYRSHPDTARGGRGLLQRLPTARGARRTCARSASGERRNRTRLWGRAADSTAAVEALLRLGVLYALALAAERSRRSALARLSIRPDAYPDGGGQLPTASRIPGWIAISLRHRKSLYTS